MLPLLTQRLHAMDPSLIPEVIRNSLRESQRAQTAFALRLAAELFRVTAHVVGRISAVLGSKLHK